MSELDTLDKHRRDSTSLSLRRTLNNFSTSRPQPQSTKLPTSDSPPVRNIMKKSSPPRHLRRMVSLSSIEKKNSTLSMLGKRRLVSTEDKESVNSGSSNPKSFPLISEFGEVVTQRNVEYESVPSMRRSITIRGTSLYNPVRESNSTSRSATISSSTRNDRTSKVASSPRRSFLPRPRVDSSTTTRLNREGPSFQHTASSTPEKEPEGPQTRTRREIFSSSSTFNTMNPPAIPSSPSPLGSNGRGGNAPIATQTRRRTSEVDPSKTTRRTSMVQSNSRVSRSESTRSRRTSMIVAPKELLDKNLAIQQRSGKRMEREHESSPLGTSSPNAAPSWGRWREAEKTNDGIEDLVEADTSASRLDFLDFYNGSLLMEGDVLKEMDAEVGRLELEKSLRDKQYRLTPTEALEKGQASLQEEAKRHQSLLREEARIREEQIRFTVEEERREEVQKREIEFQQRERLEREQQALLLATQHERDEAKAKLRQIEAELEIAQSQITADEEARLELELQRKVKSDMGSQTEPSLTLTPAKETMVADMIVQEAQAKITLQIQDRIIDDWKSVTNLANSQIVQMQHQSDLCSFFLTQLDIFQRAIE